MAVFRKKAEIAASDEPLFKGKKLGLSENLVLYSQYIVILLLIVLAIVLRFVFGAP